MQAPKKLLQTQRSRMAMPPHIAGAPLAPLLQPHGVVQGRGGEAATSCSRMHPCTPQRRPSVMHGLRQAAATGHNLACAGLERALGLLRLPPPLASRPHTSRIRRAPSCNGWRNKGGGPRGPHSRRAIPLHRMLTPPNAYTILLPACMSGIQACLGETEKRDHKEKVQRPAGKHTRKRPGKSAPADMMTPMVQGTVPPLWQAPDAVPRPRHALCKYICINCESACVRLAGARTQASAGARTTAGGRTPLGQRSAGSQILKREAQVDAGPGRGPIMHAQPLVCAPSPTTKGAMETLGTQEPQHPSASLAGAAQKLRRKRSKHSHALLWLVDIINHGAHAAVLR